MEKTFSSEVKDELCLLNIKTLQAAAAELAAMLIFGENTDTDNIVIKSGRAENAARIQALLKKAGGQRIAIDVSERKNIYTVKIPKNAAENLGVYITEQGDIELDEEIIENENEKRAFLRGAFIVSGTITPPEKNYSCELFTMNENMAYIAAEILESLGVKANTVKRKEYFVTYLNDCESVTAFLGIIGAHTALLHLMTTQVEKDYRNQTNRIFNCRVANIDKMIKAAAGQCAVIERLMASQKWEELTPQLRALAELRMENKESSLAELGEKMSPPISKSAVNRRMSRLLELAKKLD